MKSAKKEKTFREEEPVKILKQPSLLREFVESALSLLAVVAVVFLVLHFLGQRVSVDGNSMNNNLHDQDQLIVDKFTYRFLHAPERFDIIVFKINTKEDTYYIKRVVGLPGETIQIVNSTILINGEPVTDPYLRSQTFRAGAAAVPITLKENEYFVLGDNINESEDSRYSVGAVNISQVMGRAVFRFLPLSGFGSLRK